MFFRNKDLSTMEIAKQAVAQLRTDNSRLRRQSMKKRLDYYYGKQLTYLDELLRDHFKHPERLMLQKEFLNVTEMIVNEIAVLYSEFPKRELIDIEENEDAESLYAEIIECGKLDATMSLANKLTKLCKTTLVRPVWREEKLEFDIYTPNMFDVIQDVENPTKAIGIIYSNQIDMILSKNINNDDKRTTQDEFALPNTVFYVWTAKNHFAFTYTMNQSSEVVITMIKNANNPNNENPYGVMPFVVLYDGVPVNNFFVEGGDDLINANEITNVKLVEKNHLTKMQSFSLLIRKGADSTKDAVVLDPSMLLDIPADDDIRKGVDMKYITPDAKISDMEEDIQWRLKRLAIKNKINPDMFVTTGNRPSADTLQMQSYYLGKVIRADKPIYTFFEKELFETMRIVFNYHSPKKLPEEANLFIDYKDIEVPTTVEQEDAHNVILQQNGLLSKADWLMEENPDIREKDQAMEKLQEIAEEDAELKKIILDNAVQDGLMQNNNNPNMDQNNMDGNMNQNPDPKNIDMNKKPINNQK